MPDSAIEIEGFKSIRMDCGVTSKKSRGSVVIYYKDYLNVTKSEQLSTSATKGNFIEQL